MDATEGRLLRAKLKAKREINTARRRAWNAAFCYYSALGYSCEIARALASVLYAADEETRASAGWIMISQTTLRKTDLL